MKEMTKSSSPRIHRLRGALVLALVAVCLAAAWYWLGASERVWYSFRRLVASEALDCQHPPCQEPCVDSHGYCYIRIWAIGAEGNVGRRYLLAKLQTGSEEERCAALAALSLLGYKEVIQPAAALVESQSQPVRLAAAWALRDCVTDASTAALRDCMESEDSLVFNIALSELFRRRDSEIDRVVAGALARKEPHLRRYALDHFDAYVNRSKHCPGSRTIGALRNISKSDPDPALRERGTSILKQLALDSNTDQ